MSPGRAGGRGGGGRGAVAGDSRRGELAAALRAWTLPGWGGLLLGRSDLGVVSRLRLLATLGSSVLEPHLDQEGKEKSSDLMASYGYAFGMGHLLLWLLFWHRTLIIKGALLA